ncbi:MAG: ATPase/histidine kinase/DNA gyrase domain protein, partial [Bacilli bacterium]|nr:ATPase/histidine kinase/DNA gyrase domain protein [Bacilli bacterium]
MKNKYAIKSLLVAFISIQLWFFYIMFTYPISGANLEKKDNHWVVSHFDPRSTAAEQGLKKGDIIVNVNGLKADEYDSVIKWRSIDQADNITVSRDG